MSERILELLEHVRVVVDGISYGVRTVYDYTVSFFRKLYDILSNITDYIRRFGQWVVDSFVRITRWIYERFMEFVIDRIVSFFEKLRDRVADRLPTLLGVGLGGLTFKMLYERAIEKGKPSSMVPAVILSGLAGLVGYSIGRVGSRVVSRAPVPRPPPTVVPTPRLHLYDFMMVDRVEVESSSTVYVTLSDDMLGDSVSTAYDRPYELTDTMMTDRVAVSTSTETEVELTDYVEPYDWLALSFPSLTVPLSLRDTLAMSDRSTVSTTGQITTVPVNLSERGFMVDTASVTPATPITLGDGMLTDRITVSVVPREVYFL